MQSPQYEFVVNVEKELSKNEYQQFVGRGKNGEPVQIYKKH